MEKTTTQGYLCQSFDYPTDTLLPGMMMVDDADAGVQRYLTSWNNTDDPSPGDCVCRIENHGLPELVVYKGKNKVYRTGQWNGERFSSLPQSDKYIFNSTLEFRQGRLIRMVGFYGSSVFLRSKLDASGLVQRYTMNSRGDMWTPTFSFPQDQCEEYGHCGPYAICRFEKVQRCQCFLGFEPVSQDDWDRQHWYSGCRRVEPLNCMGGDGFKKVEGVKYPDMLKFRINTSMSLGECKDECLRNCNCTAVANAYVTHGGTGCVMWLGDLIDIRQVPGSHDNQNLYIRLPIPTLGKFTFFNLKTCLIKYKVFASNSTFYS